MNETINIIIETIEKNNKKEAFIVENDVLTYQVFYDKVKSLISFFNSIGVESGDTIAVSLPNGIDFICCYFAALFGNFIIVPINNNQPQEIIEHIIKITNPKIFINSKSMLKYPKIFSKIPINYSDNVLNNELFSIFFTSGTTNLPKGVCISSEKLIRNAIAFNLHVNLNENVRMLHILPMGYMAGFLNTILSPFIAGGTVIIAPQFDVSTALTFWQPAKLHNANAIWLTPTMAAFLARLNRDYDTTIWTKCHLKHVFVGTAALPYKIQTDFENIFGVSCFESYGMSEILLVSSQSTTHTKIHSVGRILKNIDVQTRTTQGNDLNIEKEGEIWIKSPYALLGYINSNTMEVESPLIDGWMPTGDYGYIDPEGFLFITGRIKDLIIHGGMNVSPKAVENVLLQNDSILDAAVIGKEHPFWGEEIIAFLILKPGVQFNAHSLSAFCKLHLSPDAVPANFQVVDEFPRSSNGKILKHKLKEYK